MAQPGFYNVNEHRAYPFIDSALGMPLPEAAIVDFGSVLGLRAGYSQVSSIWLYRVSRDADVVTFEFRSDAAGLSEYALVFQFPTTAVEFTRQYADADLQAGESGSSEAITDCVDDPIWEGFLVVGDLSALGLSNGDSIEDVGGATKIEPALIQNLGQSIVRTINLANAARTTVSPSDGCGNSSITEESEESFVNARCLSGDVNILPGYNCSIRQDPRQNALVINAAVGAGEGQPCEEVPLYDGEQSPDGGALLTGGPTCGEILRTINGIGGRTVRLYPGSGVKITPGVEEGVIVVDVDLHDLAICTTSIDV